MTFLKNFLLLTFITISFNAYSQTPCVDGFSGDYPCNGMEFLSHIDLPIFETGAGNDSWGWTDPETGKEYAIMGTRSSAAFVDITDPVNPLYLGKLPTHSGNSTWRDIKVYNDHAFVVSESNDHGMQVFDLTRLRDVINPPVLFTEDGHDDTFGSAHNMAINEETGYAYIIGSDFYEGGPIFINIQDPKNPVNEGGYADYGYSHDAQIVIYNGPDTDHTGKEIYIGSNETSVVIIDVTDKQNPSLLSQLLYSNTSYTHQAWMSEDQTYLFCNDEIDETDFGFNTRNIVFDLTNLDDPTLHYEYFGETPSIDHNNYTHNDELYIANYTAGVRIIDIEDIANGNMVETAFFDSHPDNDDVNYNGVWNVFPYFESGSIVLSDINLGLFIVRKNAVATDDISIAAPSMTIAPNPVNDFINIELPDENINSIEVINVVGKQILFSKIENKTNNFKLDVQKLESGIYYLRVNNSLTQKIIKI